MSFMGLGGDLSLVYKLFAVLGEDSKGRVDIRELVMGVEMFKDTPLEAKIKTIFELAE